MYRVLLYCMVVVNKKNKIFTLISGCKRMRSASKAAACPPAISTFSSTSRISGCETSAPNGASR